MDNFFESLSKFFLSQITNATQLKAVLEFINHEVGMNKQEAHYNYSNVFEALNRRLLELEKDHTISKSEFLKIADNREQTGLVNEIWFLLESQGYVIKRKNAT